MTPLPTAPAPPDLAAIYGGTRALITGGLGLIGSALARLLVELGADVTLVDALMPESSANLQNIVPIRDRVRLEVADVRSTDALRDLLAGQDYLFNLAGQSSHVASMADPLTDLDTNCRAQLALLELCRQVNPGIVIVFASTRQIYGRPLYLPVDERHPVSPVDVNGVSKLGGETFHLLYHNVYGIRTSALRLTNTYGPGMRIKDARQTFVGIWLRNLIEGVPLEVWGGMQQRDFTYVDDAAEAFLLAAACPKAVGRAFNVGGDGVLNLQELAQMMIDANGAGEFQLRTFPPERKRIDIGDYYANDTQFRALTGWRPRMTLEQGLKETLAYFRAQIQHYV